MRYISCIEIGVNWELMLFLDILFEINDKQYLGTRLNGYTV